MKNIIALFSVMTIYLSVCNAQVRQDHVSFYAGDQSGESYASFIKTDQDGNYFVAGRSHGLGTKFDYALIKYSSSGEVVWERRYNGEAGGNDEPFALYVDTKGNSYITGASLYLNDRKLSECVTIKYDRDGNIVWLNTYRNAATSDGAGRSICMDSEGNIFIAACSNVNTGMKDMDVIRINNAGKTVWSRTFDANSVNADYTDIIKLYKENLYIACGGVTNITNGTDFLLLSYNINGNLNWYRTHNGNINGFDVARSVHVDKNGFIYMTGYTENRGSKLDITTMKYNSAGTLVWCVNYGGNGNGFDWPNHVLTDEFGNVYVEGGTQNEIEINPECISIDGKCRNDATLLKYTASGQLDWVRIYNGPDNMYDCLQGMTIDKDNYIYVAGRSHGELAGTDDDMITMKYNVNGDRLWLMRYNSGTGRKDYGNAITVDNSGNVFASGWSDLRGMFDFIAIKYAKVERDNVINDLSVSNFPNPFNPVTVISFNLPVSGDVSLRVYDVSGRVVSTLVNNFVNAGTHEVNFNGSEFSSGVYFYKLESEGIDGNRFLMTRKMMLIK